MELNPNTTLDEAVSGLPEAGGWVTKNTAMLVIHGIGNQLPLETLDQLGRGLITEYAALNKGATFRLEHVLVSKPSDNGNGTWFDNVLRIHLTGSDFYLDLYEYYWANYTEDKADFDDIQHWLSGVTDGAEKFYAKIAKLNMKVGGGGPFFDSTGNFIHWKYSLFLKAVTYLIPIVRGIFKLFLWLLSFIPYVGAAAKSFFSDFSKGLEYNLSNVIGDIVVYNVTDPKSKYYSVKRLILDGAVSALSYLVEKTNSAGDELFYPSVIVAGHSLGTQVSYDAINKLDLLINEGKISTYDTGGNCTLAKNIGKPVTSQLTGYVTFGSPLDKIAFFLREMVPDSMYLRQQLLDDYHGFKQKDWDTLTRTVVLPPSFFKVDDPLVRLLDTVPWRNYYDHRDYVSGQLEYYDKLTNIDCRFPSKWYGFTHSYYWDDPRFYKDMIFNFLA